LFPPAAKELARRKKPGLPLAYAREVPGALTRETRESVPKFTPGFSSAGSRKET